MASLTTLPVEIVLDIVQYVLGEDSTLSIGRDAAWAVPADSRIYRIWEKARPSDASPGIVEENEEGDAQTDAITPQRRRYCSIKALRSTSRFFDELCQPFLYRELNLMCDLGPTAWTTIERGFPKWSYIRSISIPMDNGDSEAGESFFNHAVNVSSIILECEDLRSLALYYRQDNSPFMVIEGSLNYLFKNGRLSSLGFYSYHILRDAADTTNSYCPQLVSLLDSLARDKNAQRSLRKLDVVTDSIKAKTFDLIRSNFKGLTSFTLRRVLKAPWYNSRVWNIDQRAKWHLRGLTQLQLAHFEPGHAAHIPPLIAHFTALKELTISACGNDSNFITKYRSPGWSKRPDAMCNTHQILTVFHIEHMDDWELYELGVIPTTTLIVTTVKKHHLLACLRKDPEIFPGLGMLRLAPLGGGLIEKGDDTVVAGKPSIRDVCRARNVDLRRDATAYWTCVCTSEEGY